MRCEPEDFADQEMALVYVAKKLKDALRVEEMFTGAGLDYLVETDTYHGGVIFRSERVGAFFYVEIADESAARAALIRAGFQPHQE